MAIVAPSPLPEQAEVVLGVDTHKEIHVAAVLTVLGVFLAGRQFPATAAGYRGMVAWARSFGTLAEFERDLIRERTQAGLLAARARGRLGGRPKALDPRDIHVAQALYHGKSNSIVDICCTLRISRATLCRYITTGTGKPT